MRLKRWQSLGLVLPAIVIMFASAAAAQKIGLHALQEKVGRFEKIEFAIQPAASHRNPFDPEEIDVSLRITNPRGATLTVPAFSGQEYERERIDRGGKKVDWLHPVGPPVWRARFSPLEVGRYSAVAVCRDSRGTTQSDPVAFDVTPSTRKGFVRVSKRDGRFLELDNGEPLFLIGQNLAFIGETQYVNLVKAEKIFAKLAENGANFLRVWICCDDWAIGIESHKSAWGRSWEPKPQMAPLPGEENSKAARKCLPIPGEGETALICAPSHPLAVRPEKRYVLSGKIRTEGVAKVRIAAETPGLRDLTLTGDQDKWTPFSREFTTGPGQRWLDRITLRREGAGKAWLDGFSLKEGDGGPELLWEAEINRPARGCYNPTDCFMVDKLVEAADRAGIYLQLCVMTRNLYMDALKDPKSSAYRQAIRDARKVLRYAVARWGYATSVAAWEYWNEQDPGLPTDLFYTDLGRYFEQIDPFHHLRVTSTWGPSPKDWRHPRLDIAEPHHYLRPESKEGFRDEAEVVLQQTRLVRKDSPREKPLILAEFGLAENNWQLSPYMKQDKELVHFHNILWASALSGAAGTAQFWWWEQLDQQNAYRHYKPLSKFLAGVPFTTAALTSLEAKVLKGRVRPIGLQGKSQAYLWLQDPEATWWNLVVENARPGSVDGAAVELRGFEPREYRVQWWDTNTGSILREQRSSVADGVLRLDVPEFSRDIACKVLP